MKNIFIILLFFSFKCTAQLTSLVVRNDTLFNVDPTTGVWTQLTKLAGPLTGQSGKVLSNNGIGYTWTTPFDGTALNADNISSGIVPAARLGSGSSITTKFLRGDNTWQTIAGGGDLVSTNNLSDLTNAGTARTNLGLGTLATQSGTFSGTSSGTNTGDQTTVSGNAGTATTLQTARKIDGSSFDGSADITTNNTYLAYAALGSPVLAQTVGQGIDYANTSTALVDGQIKYTAVYLPKAATLTGVKVYVRTAGSYTGDNNNRVGLYTYSSGTLTLVASSTNSSSLWTSGANAIQTIAFSGTYSASAGLYFVGMLYNQSAQTTAPALASGIAINNLAMISTALGFTNSAKLHGTSSGTDIPSSIAMSSITASKVPSWVALY